jgi:hypothetical protein
MKVSFMTYVCFGCAEIFDFASQGRCPACTSTSVYSLTRLLSPREDQESWAARIRPGKRKPEPIKLRDRIANRILYLTERE